MAQLVPLLTPSEVNSLLLGATLIPDKTAELSDPLVIRPTSETIIWSTFSRWIKSYKDLPLKVNQWANVMRCDLFSPIIYMLATFVIYYVLIVSAVLGGK